MIESKISYILNHVTDPKITVPVRHMLLRYSENEEKITHYYSMDEQEQSPFYEEFTQIYREQKEILDRINTIYGLVLKQSSIEKL